MDRRAFLRTMTGLLAVVETFAARAQMTRAARRIGWLTNGSRDIEQLIAPLRELGWTEGQNLLVERRYADARPAALQTLAEELVRLRVELIVTGRYGRRAGREERHHHDTDRNVFRWRPCRGRFGCEPRAAGRQYNRLLPCCSGARCEAPVTNTGVVAGAQRNASENWKTRPIRIIALRGMVSTRHIGCPASNRSSSKSPRLASWTMRSPNWLDSTDKRCTCPAISYSHKALV